MEERKHPISLFLHGCSLARNLESNLPNLATNHPQMLAHQCDEIISVFTMARDQLNTLHAQPPDQQEEQGKGKEVTGVEDVKEEGSLKTARSWSPMEAGGSSSFSSQRKPKRTSSRKEDHAKNKRTVRVAAPQFGNTEVPPEDGFTWRKYGQKEILGSIYPRSYYRCTHQKLYNCPAKKQVQRLDNDPFTFEILYRGDHTCHMSPTAPSVQPPSSQAIQDTVLPHHQPISAGSAANQWLFVDHPRPSGDATHTIFDPHLGQLFRVRSSSSILGSDYAPAVPSVVGSHHQGRDAVDFNSNPMELADAMFNSGSNSSNSMDFVFPPYEDKWEAPRDRND